MEQHPESALTYEVFPLAVVLEPRFKTVGVAVRARLDSFECANSPHIQEFARQKVHMWERHGNSRTYVLISELDGEIDVPAFFTVGVAMLDLQRATGSNRKKLMGDVSMEQAGAFSIAELARSDKYTPAQLPGSVILDEAKEVVKRARGYIGGRFLMVDSQPIIFDKLYAPAGFKKLDVATPPKGMEGTEFVTSCCVIKDWKIDPGS